MTKELEALYSEYKKIWGWYPCGYEEVEYGKNSCKEYPADIKKALKMGVELPDVYPSDDEF